LATPGSKLLLGFSVGGSAIWQLYAQGAIKQSLGAICFYSSQIRHLIWLTPNIATRLILPSTEPHFSVAALGAILREKSTVNLEKSKYLHGVMNQSSAHYDGDAYLYYLKRLADLLLRQYSQHILEEKLLSEY
jgi:dienelactone hydrolase